MATEIFKELGNTTSELTKLLSGFTQEQFNLVPFEGSWTSAQLAEHLNKSYDVAKLLFGQVRETTRPPDEKINEIKEIFLNFNTKMKSPDFIVPENKVYDKTALLSSLTTGIKKLEEAKSLNLSETCTAFALPNIGELTRMEWICFVIYHTQRHVHQLKNIAEKVERKDE